MGNEESHLWKFCSRSTEKHTKQEKLLHYYISFTLRQGEGDIATRSLTTFLLSVFGQKPSPPSRFRLPNQCGCLQNLIRVLLVTTSASNQKKTDKKASPLWNHSSALFDICHRGLNCSSWWISSFICHSYLWPESSISSIGNRISCIYYI